MQDPTVAMAILTVFAVVIGSIIFGGTTLGYFLYKRQAEPASTGRHLDGRPQPGVRNASRDRAA